MLLYSRLAIAFIIVAVTLVMPDNSKWIVLFLLITGILTDIFDGIIARKLEISTVNFRLLDTIFDLFFYLSVLVFINSTNHLQISDNLKLILVILSLEAMMYLISLIRFGKLPSPHAILSKFWGIYLVVEFSLLILSVQGNHFTIALCIGLAVHIDRVLIYALLRKWDHDIPSSYHALLIWNGKQIERNKLFNG
jgi:phosphatidylglycerophosphate synthase